jgi:hypothetical protein
MRKPGRWAQRKWQERRSGLRNNLRVGDFVVAGAYARGIKIVNSRLDETAGRENMQDLNTPNRNILLFSITLINSHSLLLAHSLAVQTQATISAQRELLHVTWFSKTTSIDALRYLHAWRAAC